MRRLLSIVLIVQVLSASVSYLDNLIFSASYEMQSEKPAQILDGVNFITDTQDSFEDFRESSRFEIDQDHQFFRSEAEQNLLTLGIISIVQSQHFEQRLESYRLSDKLFLIDRSIII